MTMRDTKRRIVRRTNEIKVGGIYFLSSFYDKDGAMVKVHSKSTQINAAGWPSTVWVEVLERIGNINKSFYAIASMHSVNSTNLYETREQASHKRIDTKQLEKTLRKLAKGEL